MRTILVVEDEPQIAGLVRDYLEHAGFAVLTAGDGAAGPRARAHPPARRDRPGPRPAPVDGLDVIRALRRDSTVPIVILTARGDETDRVTGLELGADDYVVKPFSPKELVARVRAVLRRVEARANPDERIVAGDLELDLARRRVTAGGRRVDLTPTEFELLATLAREPGRVWTRSQLLDAVHGFSLETYERAIDGHIRNLRRKLEPDDCLAAVRPDGPRRRLRARGAGARERAPPAVTPRPLVGSWAQEPPSAEGGWGRHRGRQPAVGFFGCMVLALVILVGLVTTLATWIAGALLGVVAPGAAPSDADGRRRRRGDPGSRSSSASASSARPSGPSPTSPPPQNALPMASPASASGPRSPPGPRARRLVQRDGRAPRPVPRRPPGAPRGRHPRAPDAAHGHHRRARGHARRRPSVRRGPRRPDPRRDAGHGPTPGRPADPLARRRGRADAAPRAGRPARHRRRGRGREPAARRCAWRDTGCAGVERLVTSVDPVRVREIIANLVANAIRHTPAGGSVVVAVEPGR